MSSWPIDFLEYTVASLQMQLPTWWQIHEAAVAGKNPYECKRKATPRPPGVGLFVSGLLATLLVWAHWAYP